MQLESILKPERTRCGTPGVSKKRTLHDIAEFVASSVSSIDAGDIFSRLTERERLGSTGIGNGIAIPHCRIANCSTVIGALFSLQTPVDFEAIDGKPVDLVFTLLVPEESFEDHLQTLATLAENFSRDTYCQALRSAQDDAELYRAALDY